MKEEGYILIGTAVRRWKTETDAMIYPKMDSLIVSSVRFDNSIGSKGIKIKLRVFTHGTLKHIAFETLL